MLSISIIIPVYNVEPFVQRCLESVMLQDQADADVECIIVDDCGIDGSMGIVRKLIGKYHGPIRFFIVQHEQNRGLSAARNTGLSKAIGDYIMFVDSDDYLLPDSIQYFLDNLIQYPAADIIMGNVKNVKNDDVMIHNIQEPWYIDDPDVFFRRVLHHQIYLYAWNKLIRRNILLEHGLLFEEGTIYEDQLWSYMLFSHISSVLLLPRVTYIYEYNINSIVNTTFTSEKSDKTVWSFTVSCSKMLDNPPVAEKYKRNMTVDYLLFIMYFLMNGVDVLSRCPVSPKVIDDFLAVRKRLLLRAMRYGRLLLTYFILLLFPPLCNVQRLRFFRHHYHDLESLVNNVSHLTDFLHNRFRV